MSIPAGIRSESECATLSKASSEPASEAVYTLDGGAKKPTSMRRARLQHCLNWLSLKHWNESLKAFRLLHS